MSRSRTEMRNSQPTLNIRVIAKDVEILVKSLESKTLEHLAGAIADSILANERCSLVGSAFSVRSHF